MSNSVANGIRKASVPLTNANFISLPSTPVSIVATPGAGFRIKLIAATLSINNTAADYTGVDTTFCAIYLNSINLAGRALSLGMYNDSAYGLTDVTDFLAGANTRKYYDFQIPYVEGRGGGATVGAFGYVTASGGIYGAVDVEDDAVVLAMDNNSSVTNLGGGNASNVGLVTVYYTIEALAP